MIRLELWRGTQKHDSITERMIQYGDAVNIRVMQLHSQREHEGKFASVEASVAEHLERQLAATRNLRTDEKGPSREAKKKRGRGAGAWKTGWNTGASEAGEDGEVRL